MSREHLDFPPPAQGLVGSSPRERGTLAQSDRQRKRDRFIPARAGNAQRPIGKDSPDPVHPRASGERDAGHHLAGRARGSSPRERGTRNRATGNGQVPRFIPARAGNAGLVRKSHRLAPVHPRASGERKSRPECVKSSAGSSPRERGTQLEHLADLALFRFIPARAGNASAAPTRRSRTTVHPRASGERRSSPGRLRLAGRFIPARAGNAHLNGGPYCGAAGSSPRERGTPAARRCAAPGLRFIPARAGNAARRRSSHSSRPVHPRASGERSRISSTSRPMRGSSPRERGTRPGAHDRGAGRRFIPARAGNAVLSFAGSAWASVHPRASGERAESDDYGPAHPGSSPRERGTHLAKLAQVFAFRFIPARAGNASH